MGDRDEDRDIKSYLIKQTNEMTEKKAGVWEKINDELNETVQSKQRSRRNRKHWLTIAAMAIVISIVWVGLSMTPGLALIQNLKDMFIAEKRVEINIEGEVENTHVELEANEALQYVIYIDTERYKLIEGAISDKVVPAEDIGEQYPEVSMEIMRVEGTTEAVIESVKNELTELDMEITREVKVEAPLEAVEISAIGIDTKDENGRLGKHWDTNVYKYYITSAQDGQLFVIKEKYFLEAAEGHGARFYYMLETFEIMK